MKQLKLLLWSFLLLAIILAGYFFSRTPVLLLQSFYAHNFELNREELQLLVNGEGPYLLVLPQEHEKKLSRLFGLKKKPKIVAANNLQEFLLNNRNYIAAAPWHYAGPQLRTLRWEGNYFWDQSDHNKYPFYLSSFSLPKFNVKNLRQVALGGTVVLARGVHAVIQQTGDILYPWRGIADILRRADCTIVNLKSPLVHNYEKPESKWLLYGKAVYVQGLKFAGIDIVSISGNHMGDAGVEGLKETMKILTENAIQYTGAGNDRNQACAPIIYDLGNFKIGFLAFNSVHGSIAAAGPNSFGISWLDDKVYLADLLKKTKDRVDFLIVMPNWGQEYVAVPDKQQEGWAKFFIEHGADLVAGDQAHWLQRTAFYRNKFISYGLGNLVFDQLWSSDTREGVIERFFFYNGQLLAVDLIPLYLPETHGIKPVHDPEIVFSIFNKLLGE